MPCFRAWADAFRLSSQKSETDGCRSATTGVGSWRFKTQASRLDLISVPLLKHVSGSVPRPSLSPLRYSLQFEVAMSQWARESESNLASWSLDSRCHDSVEAARCCYPVFYLGRTTKQWSKSPSTISATTSTTSTQLNSTFRRTSLGRRMDGSRQAHNQLAPP
ncbi:hypothetical protein FOIG_01267 [Fusarium odoratissimum NRRL 54006]|uniref:Uncharacterized protein n=2 Tax=Fusarium oxysporum species complex TaxID=171631 RepID=X0LT35_FUSO5|nr:uncharacterized protein FOIG_01267 [Fusarium odoratissimum NRRL 54006]EXM11710.1 hypothetical protein FOIG_01267 [Fusarium odoratissimum NRRL 54006]TXC03341.1 hypothetical protein FocTR4_00000882 [Fusarium oxysporum f. sp. cubense]